MIRMKREFPGSQNSIFPVFDTLLLLDRNVDLLTPLATQLTYEGLIDEIYGIQNSEYCWARGLGCLSASLNDSDVGAAHWNLVQGWFSPKLELIRISSGSLCTGREGESRAWLLNGHFVDVGWEQAQWHGTHGVGVQMLACASPSSPLSSGTTLRGQEQFVKGCSERSLALQEVE